MRKYQRGDKVTVTLIGTIDAVDEVNGWWISVRPDRDHTEPSVIFSPKTVDIEVKEDLEHGAVYKDSIGDVWLYIDPEVDGRDGQDHFLIFGSTTEYNVDIPARPLKRVD